MTDENTLYQLGDTLAGWQREVVESPARYVIVQGDPGVGKTYAVLSAIAKHLLEHPGCMCVYYGQAGTGLKYAQNLLVDILTSRGKREFEGTMSYSPTVVKLTNGSTVYFLCWRDTGQQMHSLQVRYAVVDMNVPQDVSALSACSQDGIAMTIDNRWYTVRPRPPRRTWIESVQPSSRNFFTRMMEADWKDT